jgi:cleavage and polyadenylation specificity factor subunit 1
VVAKTSLLQIFDFKSVITEVDGEPKENVETSAQDIAADTLDRTFFTSDIALQRTEHTSKLVLLGEYPLSGTVTSLARIKALNTKSGAEALLVAFVDAKVSLVEWDSERHCISTISIHYYESGLPSNPWAPKLNQCPNYLTVDPRSRCAALRFGPRHLAILPFRQLGDDLVEDDFDPDLDDPADRPSLDTKMANGDGDSSQTPYAASFILPLTILDPELTFPVHLAFLYEYREPTFGILSAVRAPSSSLTLERRDVINYTVFTLDIDQQASTTILSVTDLPTDINRVMPLPLPVGGALLIGLNEFIHVDQGGKTTGIAVNDFARHSSAFAMTDHSNVGLRLEGCTVEQLSENGDLLVVLASGELAILGFKLDGRSVSGINVHKVSPAQGGLVAPTGVTCASALGRSKVFLGSEDNDSVVLGWSRKTSQLSRKRSHGDILGEDADISFDEDDIDDEDDIYATEAKPSASLSRSSNSESVVPDNLTFRVHDKLPNFAPAGDVVFANPHPGTDEWNPYDVVAGSQLVYPNGHGKTGGLAICSRELDLDVHRTMKDIPNIQAVWSFHAKTPAPKGMVPNGKQDSEGLLSADAAFDQFLIMSQASEQDNEASSLYSITPTGFDKVQKGDFEPEGATVDVGTLAGGTRIVQVRSGEVRCYNSGKFTFNPTVPINFSTRYGFQSMHLEAVHLLCRRRNVLLGEIMPKIYHARAAVWRCLEAFNFPLLFNGTTIFVLYENIIINTYQPPPLRCCTDVLVNARFHSALPNYDPY